MAENKKRSPLDLWDDKTENATKADIFSFAPPCPLRHTGERSYITLHPLMARYLQAWLDAHHVPYVSHDGDNCEIPDGVQQYWTMGKNRWAYRGAKCFETDIPFEDMKKLVNAMSEAWFGYTILVENPPGPGSDTETEEPSRE